MMVPAQPPRLPPPIPTPIFRMVHIDCLSTIVVRGMMHAPSSVPADGLPWRSIHATQTQADRGQLVVPCGPGGVIRDYVGFYFGPRSPMLYRLHTGYNVARVEQADIIYLASTAQAVRAHPLGFVFTDRHSLARVAAFYDDLASLGYVDFVAAYAKEWKSTPAALDRQEKKQAEFLVHQAVPWGLVSRIGVLNAATAARVNAALPASSHRPPVAVEKSWYY